MPNGTNLNVIGWNQEKGYIACGGDQGLLKVLKLDSGKGQGGGNLSMNQNLQGHAGKISQTTEIAFPDFIYLALWIFDLFDLYIYEDINTLINCRLNPSDPMERSIPQAYYE